MKKIEIINLYIQTIEKESTIKNYELNQNQKFSFYNLSSFIVSIIMAVLNGTISIFNKLENLSFYLLLDYFLSIVSFGLCIYIAIYILMFFVKKVIPTLFEIVFSDKHSTKRKEADREYFYQCMIPKLSLLNEYELLLDSIENNAFFNIDFSSIKYEIMMKYSKYIFEIYHSLNSIVPPLTRFRFRTSIYKNYLIFMDYSFVKQYYNQFQQVFNNYKNKQSLWGNYYSISEINRLDFMIKELQQRLNNFK
ncbi:hypothetical protein [Faecalitalea cylindroides]|uniref:Uncharacterized protein n=1 Tax=Faecalitalea cylindroides ATCC 27803 TaxID=649755 RepID=U2PPB4_9FIRM|nr:hypothetical protein [Faecalitalea cylindroides]ERK45594.1 hypothetical protein HMPREF0367_00939 [[Eubacterium] cylindroides ATCC 27803] [Faecalitalea cylindroides ATCC 27803]